MRREPYRAAPRAFRRVASGGSHRGAPAVARLHARYPPLTLAHPPTRAPRRNRIASYSPLVQRNVRTPDDSPGPAAVETRSPAFETPYNDTAAPFHRRCTRADLDARLAALPDPSPPPPIPEASGGRLAAQPYRRLRNGALSYYFTYEKRVRMRRLLCQVQRTN